MRNEKMKAYIVSRKNGVVQIGNTVYQPCTGAIFSVGRGRPKGVSGVPVIEVEMNDMESAKMALEADARNEGV